MKMTLRQWKTFIVFRCEVRCLDTNDHFSSLDSEWYQKEGVDVHNENHKCVCGWYVMEEIFE